MNIKKKHLIVIISILLFSIVSFFSIGASGIYHYLQDVVTPSGESIDLDNNGIVDNADSTLSIENRTSDPPVEELYPGRIWLIN